MAEDKPGGDDLFEDLDKFFAPIRDVDWEADEPAKPSAERPREEHVSVTVPDLPDETPSQAPPSPPAADEDEGEDWFDTGVLEPIDELLGEPVEADPAMVETTANPVEPGELEGRASVDEPPAETVTQPLTFEAEGPPPTEEEIEAAAEHFAGSMRADDEVAPESAPADESLPVTGPFLEEEPLEVEPLEVEDDILSDLDDTQEAQRTVVVGAEGLGGPSWQEPTAIEVGADLDRRGPGPGERDVPAAFLTGLVLAGIALGTLLLPGKAAFAILAGIVVLVAQGELFGVMVKQHHQPATAVGLVTGGLIVVGAYESGEPAVLAMFALGVIAAFLWFLAAPATHRRGALTNLGLTIMNVAYIPLLASFLVVTLVLDGSDGKALVVAVIGLTFVFDTAAFLVGSVWGGSFFQRPLAPNTSPRKSLEGLIGATLVTIFVSMALVPSFVAPFEDKRIESLALAVVVAVGATLGDLAESLIKRDMGIKDMGSVLPGHGGLLDRIDSLLFVAPAAFLLFRMIFV